MQSVPPADDRVRLLFTGSREEVRRQRGELDRIRHAIQRLRGDAEPICLTYSDWPDRLTGQGDPWFDPPEVGASFEWGRVKGRRFFARLHVRGQSWNRRVLRATAETRCLAGQPGFVLGVKWLPLVVFYTRGAPPDPDLPRVEIIKDYAHATLSLLDPLVDRRPKQRSAQEMAKDHLLKELDRTKRVPSKAACARAAGCSPQAAANWPGFQHLWRNAKAAEEGEQADRATRGYRDRRTGALDAEHDRPD